MALYQEKVWSSATGTYWYSAYTDSFVHDNWILPARILNMELDKYLLFVINKFDGIITAARSDGSFVGIGFKTETAAKKWRTYINSVAKRRNFQV